MTKRLDQPGEAPGALRPQVLLIAGALVATAVALAVTTLHPNVEEAITAAPVAESREQRTSSTEFPRPEPPRPESFSAVPQPASQQAASVAAKPRAEKHVPDFIARLPPPPQPGNLGEPPAPGRNGL